MEAVKNIMDTITYYFDCFYGNGRYLALLLAAVAGLFILSKKDRKLIYPILILILVIANPVLYRYVFNKLVFWRLFWMIPEVLIIALAATRMIMTLEKKWEKTIGLVLVSAIIILLGQNGFKNGGFAPAENAYKIPQSAADVYDAILEKDDSPRAIMPLQLLYYARMYDGSIETMYGRDVEGTYIVYSDQRRKDMYAQIESEDPDYRYIISTAYDQGYNFVVISSEKIQPDPACLAEFGYEDMGVVNGYRILYREETK
jgi:hypothetical protein